MDLGFPGDSDGKESACDAGDLGLIPGLGRSLEGAWQPTPGNILAWKIATDREARWATVQAVKKSQLLED